MAKENVNIVEKAKRLVELCRECSRDSKRKAPVWLSHVRIGCGLENEYPPYKMHQGGEFHVVYPSHDVGVKRFYCMDGGDIIDSVHECLECYSDLIVEKTKYDAMEVWQRGLSLLAEYYTSKREVYWIIKREEKQPITSHSTFENLELLKNNKEDSLNTHIIVSNGEDSGTYLDICNIPEPVYDAWLENQDARWVIRWKNIFRDIESATRQWTIKPPKDLRRANWFEIRTKKDDLVLLSSGMLRKAISDGRLTNFKPEAKPNAPNLYSIQQVKTVYPEYSAYLVD